MLLLSLLKINRNGEFYGVCDLKNCIASFVNHLSSRFLFNEVAGRLDFVEKWLKSFGFVNRPFSVYALRQLFLAWLGFTDAWS